MSKFVLSLCLSPVLFAIGCADAAPNSRVSAILRVHRGSFTGTATDFMVYRETQASLLKSKFVLQSALNDDDIRNIKNLDVASLANSIRVNLSENSELLRVEMEHPNLNRSQSAVVLDKVLEAYAREVVDKERLEKIAWLEKLRERQQRLDDKVKERTDQIAALAKQMGGLDAGNVALPQSLKLSNLNQLQRQLMKLQTRQIKWNQLKNESMSEVVKMQIQFLESRYQTALTELQKLGSWSGELEARKGDLAAIRADIQAIRAQMRDLEVELDGRETVTIIQRAQ